MPSLRRVVAEDIDQLFVWANDPSVRANAFDCRTISYPRHVSWFYMKFHDSDVFMYIYEEGAVPIGQIRFDRYGAKLEVDVSIAEEHRGKGHGVEIIRRGTLLALKEARARYVTAYVLLGNIASLKAFLAAGYNDTGTIIYMGKQVHNLEYMVGGADASA